MVVKFQLRTSKFVEMTIMDLYSATKITPNILARIAVSLSISRDPSQPYESSDRSGKEFNRDTLTGEYDYIYKALIAQHAGREITDEEYFPSLFNAHLERGIKLLSNEYKYAKNTENLVRNLIMYEQG
jgi:DNA sulfur modification protein DndE